MNCVSFSLFGSSPHYHYGGIRNAELAASLFPTWDCVFHVGKEVPSTIKRQIIEAGATIHERDPQQEDCSGYYWRFFCFEDPRYDAVIIRDVDARLLQRDVEAVEAWLESGKAFHIIRDHPYHTAPIMSGAFGARRGALADIRQRIAQFDKRCESYSTDMEFCEHWVYPQAQHDVLVHDPFFEKKPFPCPRQGYTFIGNTYDEWDRPKIEYAEALRNDTDKRFLIL